MNASLFESFLFAIVGLGLEVVETAILDYPKSRDNRLLGHASIWYIPFYATAPPAFFHCFHGFLFSSPFYVRGPIYVVAFWIVEYCAMRLLRLLLGRSPSEAGYYRSRWNVHGLIRLDLWPVWLCFGFLFEWMYRSLHQL